MPRRHLVTLTYRFPGFRARASTHGIFGDPLAVVLTLERRSKKRSALGVVASAGVGTTAPSAASAISPRETGAFTWSWRFAASLAPLAAL